MKLLIPSIMLIALIAIIYVMANEYRKRKRIKAIQEYFEQEQRFIIEKTVMRDLLYCEEYWNKNGSFNREHYINVLENR
jgi:uncharacterized protein (UPF0333 family)